MRLFSRSRKWALRIPIPFLKHIIRETSRTFYLTGPSGEIWTVSLIQNIDGYFFEEGWQEFVRDHFMELGDFCVFIYEGNMHFTVQIFDTSGCEKESAFHAICSQDYTHSVRDKGKKIGSNEAAKVLNASSYESCQCYSNRKRNMAANVTQADKQSGTLTSQRRHVTSEEKGRAINAANEFESKNPFTMIVMRHSYVYSGFCLPMPCSFKNFHLPETDQEIILRDPRGNEWPVSYVVTNGSQRRGSLSAGWGAFSYHNNIEKDDVCIFELIKEDVMQVHIFRVVDEITPLIKHSTRKRHGCCK
ncbi:B3 DNA binding domain [Macleaya cordata]|uniref:B3 DNA binding domain n=1 Tax=Macleaya cordata TaxID=56857 RepID=A0A200QY78_MACCD|nr:B3 DNA binding domain [Macleaya cordata]